MNTLAAMTPPPVKPRAYSAELYPIETRLLDAIEATIAAKRLDTRTAAALAGIGRSTLSEYLARRNHVRLDALAQIARGLGLRLHVVLRGEGSSVVDELEEVAAVIPVAPLRRLLVAVSRMSAPEIEALTTVARQGVAVLERQERYAELLAVVETMTPAQVAQVTAVARALRG